MNNTQHLRHQHQHIAVIGGGIIGLSCALHLQQAGIRVTLLDGQGMGNGASAGNAGHFAVEQVFPLADKALLPQLPGMLIDPLGPFRIKAGYFPKALPWFLRFLWSMRSTAVTNNTKAIRALNEASLAAYGPLLNWAGASDLLIEQGSLLVYGSGALAEIEKDYQHYAGEGVAVKKLNEAQLKTLEPDLDDDIKGGLLFTQAAHTVDPQRLCHLLGNTFIEEGGEFIQANVTEVHASPGQVLISHENGEMSADSLLLCAGAHSKPLASQLGYRVPLETERGYHLMLPGQYSLTRAVASKDRKFIMTPMEGGLRLAGTVEFGGLEAEPDNRRAEMLLVHAKAMLPELANVELSQLSEEARWMGFRPSLPDSLPVMDRSKTHDNVYFAFGHQHLGLTWGGISGRLMSQLITHKPTDLDMTPYRIDRF